MRLAFDIVDVFTDRPFAGNQLAVVHGAGDLSTEQCQALAREFNYSESTFPVPGDGSSYENRIFTPSQEIPFAGHPTLGTAWVLRERGLVSGDRLTQHCGAGEIGVRFDGDLVELSAAPRDLVGPIDPVLVREILREFGLSDRDRAGEAWVAGTGLSFLHVPVAEEAVVAAVPSAASFAAYADRLREAGPMEDLLDAVNVHAVAGDGPHLHVHSRVFVPGDIPEDPATGSAAAGLGMALVASGRLPGGGTYDVRQGIEMGRPSTLHGRVEATGGVATRCHVAGRVQPVASGEIEVP